MLRVDPNVRPSAGMIIQIIDRLKKDPSLIKKLSEDEKNLFILNDQNNLTIGDEGLLNTIPLP
jgi:hypothetical protein